MGHNILWTSASVVTFLFGWMSLIKLTLNDWLLTMNCFFSNRRHGGKIVGGEEAEPYSIPYQVGSGFWCKLTFCIILYGPVRYGFLKRPNFD